MVLIKQEKSDLEYDDLVDAVPLLKVRGRSKRRLGE